MPVRRRSLQHSASSLDKAFDPLIHSFNWLANLKSKALPMSPKVGIAPKRRAEIIEATFFCIALKGYSNITMQDIADSAGVSKGVIHYYFHNKEELFLSVFDKLIKDLDTHLGRKVQRAKTPPEKIRAIITAVFEKVRENKKFQVVLLDFWAHSTKIPKLQDATANQYARYRHLAKKIISEGVDKGYFIECDPARIASALIGLVEGLMIQWIFDQNAFDLSRAQKMTDEIIMGYLQR
ncbi:MAG: TetR family transcriptional regulator [Candidatus Abyssobacteria bacterium SURF_5]|uniref:TetR family transcriptional regulator n=1 Tax=Abyssobacteria bacterium (strain SURF_5) TaxID=2093360 RepID=A0A3A4N1T0_ABYX5|nr:MAG: TetR family transcriptional regulator [Candidatus Abyssubacteria bacterium SURF_5]